MRSQLTPGRFLFGPELSGPRKTGRGVAGRNSNGTAAPPFRIAGERYVSGANSRKKCRRKSSGSWAGVGGNPSVRIRAVPTNGYVNADMIYRELSQSHHTDQGNSDLKVPVKAKVHIGTSQSHRTDQGNSDASAPPCQRSRNVVNHGTAFGDPDANAECLPKGMARTARTTLLSGEDAWIREIL